MFSMDDKKKELKEGVLEKLIEHLMSMPDEGSDKEEASESPEVEGLEKLLGKDKDDAGDEDDKSEGDPMKPKLSMEVMKVDAKPKFKLGDQDMEDESLEDILKRKKAQG